MLIKGGTVITPFEEAAADVMVENGKITAVAADMRAGLRDDSAEVVDASGKIVAPGMIDVHIQGHEGRDFWEGTYEAANAVSMALPKHGVTGIAATTSGFARYIAPIAEAAERGVDGALLLGIHSEGPFLSPGRPGAIERESIAAVDMDVLKRLLDAGEGRVVIMTIAPEIAGALEAIAYLAGHGVRASLGHSMATYDEAEAGFDSGAVRVTHLFNAMTAFGDRADGGLAAAALLRRDVSVEMICDGVHLHPAVLKMIGAVKGPRMTAAITDSVKVAGLGAGHFSSGEHGKNVYVDKAGNPPRLADGTIAGSGVSMDACVRNLISLAGYSRTEAFVMASYAPAAVLGMEGQKGRIAPGCDADIVIYGDDLTVERTYIGGELKYAVDD